MTGRFLFILMFGLITSPIQGQQTELPTYWKDIRPVLRKNCAFCHAQRHIKKLDVSAGLALDTYEAIKESIKTKKVFKVGDSKNSLLVKLLLTNDANRRMPLDGDPLPKDQVELFKRWIDTGAKEGKRPDDSTTVVAKTKPVKLRKRDVTFATKAVPPKDLVSKVAPNVLSLSLKVGPLAPITAVAFSPDGKLLATGFYGQVTVWDLQKAEAKHVFSNVLGAVNDIKFSPDGKLLAIGGGQPSAKGEWKLYQLSDGKTLASFRDHLDVVFSLDFSPDGKKLATGSFDGTMQIWNVGTLKLERTLGGHSDFVYAVSFGPKGKKLASASKDRTVRISDVDSGKSIFTLGGMTNDVMAVAFSPDEKYVISSGFETALYWWNTKTGERDKLQRGHGVAVQELCFSKDGSWLISASADQTMRIWDGKKGNLLKSVRVNSPVYAVAISPDKKWIATGSFDGLVRIWDAKKGTTLLTLLTVPGQERSDWMTLTPEGYLTKSNNLPELGRWTMRGQPVADDLVWQNLQRPEQVVQSLSGKALPAPTFKK